jgi:hypothetical protein
LPLTDFRPQLRDFFGRTPVRPRISGGMSAEAPDKR